jgi:uncharacterized protein (TIGR02444 family)
LERVNTPDSYQSLWQFALAFYARQGVADACLFLQDEHNANICLLIGLRWLDLQDRILAPEDWDDLFSCTRQWSREIIEPLRKLRRALKYPFGGLDMDDLQEQIRQTIKQAELLAEKKLLAEIERWSVRILPGSQVSRDSNLGKYLTDLGVEKSYTDSLLQKLLT